MSNINSWPLPAHCLASLCSCFCPHGGSISAATPSLVGTSEFGEPVKKNHPLFMLHHTFLAGRNSSHPHSIYSAQPSPQYFVNHNSSDRIVLSCLKISPGALGERRDWRQQDCAQVEREAARCRLAQGR